MSLDGRPALRPRNLAFHLLRTRISTKGDTIIPRSWDFIRVQVHTRGPQIPVPLWLIEWSKSRDLFLSLAHNPWVYRPN